MMLRAVWTDGGAVVHLATWGGGGAWMPLCSFLDVLHVEHAAWPLLRERESSWRQHSGRLVHAAWIGDDPVPDRPLCATCARRFADAAARVQELAQPV